MMSSIIKKNSTTPGRCCCCLKTQIRASMQLFITNGTLLLKDKIMTASVPNNFIFK